MATPQFTPGPWTNEPGLFWICDVGNNADDPGVWSTAIPADGVPFPFGTKEADARLIASAPDGYGAAEFSAEIIRMLIAQLATFGVEPACNAQGAIDRLEAFTAKARGEQVPA